MCICKEEDPTQNYIKEVPKKKKSQAPPARRLPRIQCEGS
jgi:hypothetical protein